MTEAAPVVFVVDDDVAMRESLKNLLRSVGLRVEAFASAQEFLRSIRLDVPGCLVLDVRLPGLSGLDLQKRMAEAGTDIPIIFLTGHADIPMSVRAMKQGAVDLLTKPVNDDDLIKAVRNAIERDRDLRTVCSQLDTLDPAILPAFRQSLRNRQVGAWSEVVQTEHKIGSGRFVGAHVHALSGILFVENGHTHFAAGGNSLGQ